MDELLDRVMRIERVRACFLFDGYGNVIAERSGEVAVEARAALRMLLDGVVRDRTQESRREIGKYKVLVRRFGKSLCGVVAEREVDESALRMQLNILSIKLNAQGLRPPPSASSPTRLPANAVKALERELVSDVGPLGKVLFEAALKRARTTSEDLSADVARNVTNRLAEEIPESARRSWLARSGAIIEAAVIRLPRPLGPLKRADEVAPASRKVSKAQVFGFGRRTA